MNKEEIKRLLKVLSNKGYSPKLSIKELLKSYLTYQDFVYIYGIESF